MPGDDPDPPVGEYQAPPTVLEGDTFEAPLLDNGAAELPSEDPGAGLAPAAMAMGVPFPARTAAPHPLCVEGFEMAAGPLPPLPDAVIGGPSAAGTWEASQPIFVLWLLSSGFTFGVGFMFLFVVVGALGCASGVLGIIGSSMYLCHCCTDRDLMRATRTISILAFIASGLAIMHATIFFLVLVIVDCDIDDDCKPIYVVLSIFLTIYLAQAVVSGLVGRKATAVHKLCSPYGNAVARGAA